MLYDPKKFALPEIKPLEPWRQCLLEAAERIRKYGWIKFKLGSENVGYCMLGAIRSTQFSKEDRAQARKHLRRYLGRPISQHNDFWAGTKKIIPQVMDSCAKE